MHAFFPMQFLGCHIPAPDGPVTASGQEEFRIRGESKRCEKILVGSKFPGLCAVRKVEDPDRFVITSTGKIPAIPGYSGTPDISRNLQSGYVFSVRDRPYPYVPVSRPGNETGCVS
jgi:hypothetical protein